MRTFIATCAFMAITATAQAQMAPLNTTITDGTDPFAEGVMTDWELQVDGISLCMNPYVIGRYITCKTTITVDGRTYQADTQTQVWPETNGELGAMVVLDNADRVACIDPMTWYRGPIVSCSR